jgi:hypothetical protein
VAVTLPETPFQGKLLSISASSPSISAQFRFLFDLNPNGPTLLLMSIRGFALLACLTTASVALPQTTPSMATQVKLLHALALLNFGHVYADDGAADGTVTNSGTMIESGPNVKPDARVKAVVDLRSAAIPLLIEHLDDSQPTRTMFQGKPTPLGFIALDILTHIIKQSSEVFIPDCHDDGLGACFEPAYYFRPDASLVQMKRVKENWRRSYRRGAVAFEYPGWWK